MATLTRERSNTLTRRNGKATEKFRDAVSVAKSFDAIPQDVEAPCAAPVIVAAPPAPAPVAAAPPTYRERRNTLTRRDGKAACKLRTTVSNSEEMKHLLALVHNIPASDCDSSESPRSPPTPLGVTRDRRLTQTRRDGPSGTLVVMRK
eukprot:TRINITY_DN97798_c0_g1_i1.p1 TRINITY_DN97798_c0_g1~~TRINITY_DN97798_c0_g1_i1.p1  ORF type:complete len:148 (+),score=8.45 TRINITY_DN97798_c0_g1_i1:367-810(+)